jgi:hypothetical protein
MFFKILLLGFFIYIVYRFVFSFLLPVYKTTQKIKQGFREMQEQANRQSGNAGEGNDATDSNKMQDKEILGEYIDFEEVK